MKNEKKFSVSVIICTCNRYDQARKCLESLLNQKEGDSEIIVVDNSDKETFLTGRENFLNFCQQKGIFYIFSGEKGLSKGRNLGIKKAKGEIIAFIDDDCLPGSNWIKAIKEGLNNHPCLTGRTISQNSGLADLGEKQKVFSYNFFSYFIWKIGHGNNMAFRREVFEKVGLFDENFGMGAKYQAGEDADFFLRCLKKGFKIIYWPKAIVSHFSKSKANLVKSAFAYQQGYKRLLLKHKDLYAMVHLLIFPPLLLLMVIKNLIFFQFQEAKLKLAKLKGFLS